ncbi:MAG TPA: hypothetical protein VF069_08210 [Streptosporangiaceae bacterium]
MRQVRIWLGIIGLIAAGYLAFDPADRMELAWTKALVDGPYILAALATVNMARSLVRSDAAFLAPVLLGSAAAVLLLRPSIGRSQVEDAVVVAVLIAAVALILREYPEQTSWTRVLWTGRARAPVRIVGRLRAVAVLADFRVDLLASVVEDRATFTAVTFGGRVVIDLPQEWRVVVRPPPRLMLGVLERGRRDAIEPGEPHLEVRLFGLAGTLELDRA